MAAFSSDYFTLKAQKHKCNGQTDDDVVREVNNSGAATITWCSITGHEGAHQWSKPWIDLPHGCQRGHVQQFLRWPYLHSLEHESAPETNGPGISLSGQYCIRAGTLGTWDAAPHFYNIGQPVSCLSAPVMPIWKGNNRWPPGWPIGWSPCGSTPTIHSAGLSKYTTHCCLVPSWTYLDRAQMVPIYLDNLGHMLLFLRLPHTLCSIGLWDWKLRYWSTYVGGLVVHHGA